MGRQGSAAGLARAAAGGGRRLLAAAALALCLASPPGVAEAALTVAPGTLTLPAGGTAKVRVSGASAPIEAGSSNAGVAGATLADVTASGATLTVSGAGAGRTTVWVRDGGGTTIRLPVTVTTAMTVAPAAMALSVGATGTIVAGNASARRLTAASANPGVATAAVAGTTVTVTAVAAGSTVVAVKDGAATVEVPVGVIEAATGAFNGTIVLGAPTATSVIASIHSPDQSGSVRIAWGTARGVYGHETAAVPLAAGTPLRLTLSGLAPDTLHYYRLRFQSADGGASGATDEYTFHTARPPGSTFTFTVQADSHLDENSDLDLYRRTLANALADAPDFHVDLGDTFMCEKHCTPLTATLQTAPNQAAVDARYAYERANFGRLAHSAPLFLVNGNHEGELGWLLNGTAANPAIWTTKARQRFFVNPVPGADGFYGGDPVDEPFVGRRASWYAWHWGDALFVVLDPFWNTRTKSNSDGWVLTLGAAQYEWLAETLAASPAKFKFVFIHNLVGGLDGQMRGGAEAAPFYEWGGRNADGTPGFAQKRPGWSLPIHALLVRHGVTAVFHGHDHVYVRQELDGIVYQEVPQPSARNFASGPNLAAEYDYVSGTIVSSSGHLRVTVGPDRVTTQYVRAWLPKNETPQRANGEIADSWSVAAP